MDNTKVKAVHDDDMMELLQSLNVYEGVINSNYTCSFCDKIIGINNIGAIFPLAGKVAFSCNDETCHVKLIKLLEGEETNESSVEL